VVLYIPADNNITLEQPLVLTRSKTVLRGAGRTKTVLRVPGSAAARQQGAYIAGGSRASVQVQPAKNLVA
jgi:hypothetical protein